MSRSLATTLAIAVVAASCGGDAPGVAEAETGPSATTTAADPLATPSVEGSFPVADGRKLALMCWGTGSPTVVLDAGTADPGISAYRFTPLLEGLATRTRVCAYDRAGLGGSDPPPAGKRYLDDAARDLHQLLDAADVPGPYLLVGSSGGGFNVFHHAGRYPGEVAGLVLLDVPAGNPDFTEADIGAWDAPENPEHMDYVAIERQMALNRLPIPRIPVTVVTAKEGDSANPEEQRVWLKGSSKPRQVVLDGGHVIYEDNPDGVLAEVVKVLESTR